MEAELVAVTRQFGLLKEGYSKARDNLRAEQSVRPTPRACSVYGGVESNDCMHARMRFPTLGDVALFLLRSLVVSWCTPAPSALFVYLDEGPRTIYLHRAACVWIPPPPA